MNPLGSSNKPNGKYRKKDGTVYEVRDGLAYASQAAEPAPPAQDPSRFLAGMNKGIEPYKQDDMGIIRSALQGATLNWADDGVQALDKTGLFEPPTEDVQHQYAEAVKNHPIAYAVGSYVNPVNLAGKASVLKAALQGGLAAAGASGDLATMGKDAMIAAVSDVLLRKFGGGLLRKLGRAGTPDGPLPGTVTSAPPSQTLPQAALPKQSTPTWITSAPQSQAPSVPSGPATVNLKTPDLGGTVNLRTPNAPGPKPPPLPPKAPSPAPAFSEPPVGKYAGAVPSNAPPLPPEPTASIGNIGIAPPAAPQPPQDPVLRKVGEYLLKKMGVPGPAAGMVLDKGAKLAKIPEALAPVPQKGLAYEAVLNEDEDYRREKRKKSGLDK